jgi:PIN domain nuclease of toxin-antitoxin system
MTYLLDTHTFLWLLRAPEMLPDEVVRLCDDPEIDLALSTATAWEMAIKAGAGKLDAADLLDDFEDLAERARLRVLETTLSQMIRSGLLPLHHRDPFDRLLAAQALELGATLLSRDRVFDFYGVKRIWE